MTIRREALIAEAIALPDKVGKGSICVWWY